MRLIAIIRALLSQKKPYGLPYVNINNKGYRPDWSTG